MNRQAGGCPGVQSSIPGTPSRAASKGRSARHELPFPPGQGGRPGQALQLVASHAGLPVRGCIDRHVQRDGKRGKSFAPGPHGEQ